MKIGFFKSRESQQSYFLWRKERAQDAIKKLGLDFAGKKVLDLGCGFGAVSEVLAEHGAEVWGLEQNTNSLSYARQFVTSPKAHLQEISGYKLPFADAFFDLVILFDVVEHLDEPDNSLAECKRVLKDGGLLYVEFPPFYSISGHHLYDLTKLPVHLLWSDEKIKNFIFRRQPVGFKTPQIIWDEYKSCNKMTINQFKKYYRKTGFKKVRERYIVKYPEVFELNLPFWGWLDFLGRLRDFFVMGFEGLYIKN